MKRFRNILVHADGRDGGRAALKRGIELKRQPDWNGQRGPCDARSMAV